MGFCVTENFGYQVAAARVPEVIGFVWNEIGFCVIEDSGYQQVAAARIPGSREFVSNEIVQKTFEAEIQITKKKRQDETK